MLVDPHIHLLKETAFFGRLPHDVFSAAIHFARVNVVPQGQAMCHQGEPAHTIFCVVSGVIKRTVRAPNGREVVVDVYERGDSFAEVLLFRSDPYLMSAIALKPSVVIAVPKLAVENALVAQPDIIPAVLPAAYAKMRRLVEQIEQLKTALGIERVARFLLQLAARSADDETFDIPFEKQAMASMLGIKPETLSRSFRRLEDHGVQISGSTVALQDRAALEAFVATA